MPDVQVMEQAHTNADTRIDTDVNTHLITLLDGMGRVAQQHLRTLRIVLSAIPSHAAYMSVTCIQHVACLTGLTHLLIEDCFYAQHGGMRDDMLHALQSLQRLTHLTLPHVHDITQLPCLSSLEQLHVRVPTLTDTGFVTLTTTLVQTEICSIILHDVTQLTDVIWLHVARLTRLHTLFLNSSHHLTVKGMLHFISLAATPFRAAHRTRALASPSILPLSSLSLFTCAPRCAALHALLASLTPVQLYPLAAVPYYGACLCMQTTCPWKRQHESEQAT